MCPLWNAKLVAEPQVKDSGKCRRTHLDGGEPCRRHGYCKYSIAIRRLVACEFHASAPFTFTFVKHRLFNGCASCCLRFLFDVMSGEMLRLSSNSSPAAAGNA